MAMVDITAFTRTEAGAVVARALEFVNDITVVNVSGTQRAWVIAFDAAIAESELDRGTGSNRRQPTDAFGWGRLCSRIEAAMANASLRPAGIPFVDFCRDMHSAADAAGQHDAATYIQHCIDDLEGSM